MAVDPTPTIGSLGRTMWKAVVRSHTVFAINPDPRADHSLRIRDPDLPPEWQPYWIRVSQVDGEMAGRPPGFVTVQ